MSERMSERERERERERDVVQRRTVDRSLLLSHRFCVRVRDRERARVFVCERESSRLWTGCTYSPAATVCTCVRVSERARVCRGLGELEAVPREPFVRPLVFSASSSMP